MNLLPEDCFYEIFVSSNESTLLNFIQLSNSIKKIMIKNDNIYKILLDYDYKKLFDTDTYLNAFIQYMKLRKIMYIRHHETVIKNKKVYELYQYLDYSIVNVKLKKIPKEIGLLKNTMFLIFNNVQLKNKRIPDEFGNLIKLTHLMFEGNNITKISKKFCNLINLKYLYLECNKIQKIPREISNLINLNYLDLKNNQIKKFDYLCLLTNLKVLKLNNNQIKKIPKEIKNMNNLEMLWLSNNQIKFVPKELSLLKKKWALIRLYDNPIQKIHQDVFMMTNIRLPDNLKKIEI